MQSRWRRSRREATSSRTAEGGLHRESLRAVELRAPAKAARSGSVELRPSEATVARTVELRPPAVAAVDGAVGVPVVSTLGSVVDSAHLVAAEAVGASVERQGAGAVDDAAGAPVVVAPHPLVPVGGQSARRQGKDHQQL